MGFSKFSNIYKDENGDINVPLLILLVVLGIVLLPLLIIIAALFQVIVSFEK